MKQICDECETVVYCKRHGCIPKQSTQQKPWINLTDKEIKEIALATPINGTNFARAIEIKLREKNI